MIGCIVQARTGSSRLPKKVLLEIEDKKTVLDFVISQLKNCKNIDKIVIATTDLSEDDVIVGRQWDAAAVAIAMMGFAVAGRVGLLVLVDASSFPATSTRYIYPTVSLFSGVMILLAHRAWVVVRKR